MCAEYIPIVPVKGPWLGIKDNPFLGYNDTGCDSYGIQPQRHCSKSDSSNQPSYMNRSDLSLRRGRIFKSKSAALFSGRESEGLVLVVDDEPDVRKVVRITLEKSGYDVVEAEDGKKAIAEIKKDENSLLLNLIITDIRMPNMNGIDVINYYRKEWPSIPLIVLTGFPDLDMAIAMLQHGVVDYLVKPVEAEKLKASVAQALDQRKGFGF